MRISFKFKDRMLTLQKKTLKSKFIVSANKHWVFFPGKISL